MIENKGDLERARENDNGWEGIRKNKGECKRMRDWEWIGPKKKRMRVDEEKWGWVRKNARE